MFKLLILLGSFISIPANQTYQTYKTYQNISAINEKISDEEKNNVRDQESEIPFSSGGGDIGRVANIQEVAKFDYLVPNWQWFTKLRSDAAVGYTDLDSTFGTSGLGLCEYISMAMLLEYQELFVSSGFFTDSEWKQWFGYSSPSSSGIKSPIHRYYRDHESENGLVRKLYHTLNKVDLWYGSDVATAFNSFLTGKDITNKITQKYSASTLHTSHPSDYIKKEGVPVMFSFVKGAHNIIVYGYNSRTDELAFHMGWSSEGGKNNSIRIVKQSSLWSFWSWGFWNTIYVSQRPRNLTRRAFEYNNKSYSWFELKAVRGIDWNDISYV